MAKTQQQVIQETIIMAVREIQDANAPRIDAIEKATLKLTEIVTGNSHPENGLCVKVDRLTQAQSAMLDAEKRRSDREWKIIGGILLAVILQVIQIASP